MTPLARLLVRRIAATGPMTIADYMAECLLHPAHGYYATRDPLGAAGDFTTAPEISQMFGELIGLCLAQAWLDRGAPTPFALAELGPGRGTLMADMLRAAGRVPGFKAGARVHLVEASPALRAVQAAALAGHAPVWHDHVADLPGNLPLFLVGNEFFDALPVRQFVRAADGWRERMVGVAGEHLCFGLGPGARISALDHRLRDTAVGDIVELRPAAAPIMGELAVRIAEHGGVALVLDYGGAASRGDTLQAVRRHAFDDPLAHPGEADLTAHVDFGALVGAADGVNASGLTPQGVLLRRLGIDQRADALACALQGEALVAHRAAHRRLTDPSEMGNLFKAVAFYREGEPPPEGFSPGLAR